MGKDRLTIRPRDLAAERGRDPGVAERLHERFQPVVSLGRGVRVEKDHAVVPGEFHALIQDAAWPVLVREHLHEVSGFCLANNINGSIDGA